MFNDYGILIDKEILEKMKRRLKRKTGD